MKKKKSIYTHSDIPISKAKYSTPCTLWIPKKYEKFVSYRLSKFLKFNHYIHFLIVNYSNLIREGKLKPNLELKTKYQEKGIGFNIECFRPFDDSDWSVLKILANSLNVSRCCLFAMFIELDMAGVVDEMELKNKNVIVITKPYINSGFREIYIPHLKILRRTIIFRYTSKTYFYS